jgi:AcrR family transcriptional regulator
MAVVEVPASRHLHVSRLDSSGTVKYCLGMDKRSARTATVIGGTSRNVEESTGAPPSKGGRKQDRSRDADILDATLEVLAEVGFADMTMDMVARHAHAGKATIYRRWTSKSELIVDAVDRLKRSQVDIEHLPDTGTLRGDLLALFKAQSAEEAERRLRAVAGVVSLITHDRSFSDSAHAVLVEPWADAHFILMKRAADRGEIPATADIQAVCQVLPAMAAYRALVQRKPFDREFLVSIVDGVILPALDT